MALVESTPSIDPESKGTIDRRFDCTKVAGVGKVTLACFGVRAAECLADILDTTMNISESSKGNGA